MYTTLHLRVDGEHAITHKEVMTEITGNAEESLVTYCFVRGLTVGNLIMDLHINQLYYELSNTSNWYGFYNV